MNYRFDWHIITHHHSEVYCGCFRRLVFGNSLTFSHIPLCFLAKPPNFPRLFDPRVIDSLLASDNQLKVELPYHYMINLPMINLHII